MSSKTRAGKNKGKSWQNKVRDDLLELFPHLEKNKDIYSTDMGQRGEDIILSELAKHHIPYTIECKAHKNGFSPVIATLSQCKNNKVKGTMPIAVVKQDYQEPFVALYYSDWLKLLKTTDTVEMDFPTALRLLAQQLEAGEIKGESYDE